MRCGAAVRTQLALQGVIDPSADEALGRALLPELGLGVRWALSRTPRPGHHPDLSTLSPGITAVDRLTIVADGMFKGWVVLAHHESVSKPGESFRAAIEQTLEVWSAVVLASSANEAAITDKLPIGRGDVLRWREVPKNSASPIMAGPVADFDITWGPFGTLKLLMPCAQLTTMSALTPAAHPLGLVLLDPAGDPAVVLRCWAETQLGDEDPGDEDHLVAGSEVLCRPDILNTTLDFTADRPFTVTAINSPSTGMDED